MLPLSFCKKFHYICFFIYCHGFQLTNLLGKGDVESLKDKLSWESAVARNSALSFFSYSDG
jgi:hypothetical protein